MHGKTCSPCSYLPLSQSDRHQIPSTVRGLQGPTHLHGCSAYMRQVIVPAATVSFAWFHIFHIAIGKDSARCTWSWMGACPQMPRSPWVWPHQSSWQLRGLTILIWQWAKLTCVEVQVPEEHAACCSGAFSGSVGAVPAATIFAKTWPKDAHIFMHAPCESALRTGCSPCFDTWLWHHDTNSNMLTISRNSPT